MVVTGVEGARRRNLWHEAHPVTFSHTVGIAEELMPYVVERKTEEEVYLDVPGFPRIPIKVLEARRGSTRLLITAPPEVGIIRAERKAVPDDRGVLPMVNPRGTQTPDRRQMKRA